MSLNLKNPEVERLAAEVATMAGETKTEAVRRALEERRERLRFRIARRDRAGDVLRFLEREVWPLLQGERLGRAPTKNERESMLGYGDHGV